MHSAHIRRLFCARQNKWNWKKSLGCGYTTATIEHKTKYIRKHMQREIDSSGEPDQSTHTHTLKLYPDHFLILVGNLEKWFIQCSFSYCCVVQLWLLYLFLSLSTNRLRFSKLFFKCPESMTIAGGMNPARTDSNLWAKWGENWTKI